VVAALAISVARCGDQPTAPHPAAPRLLNWDPTVVFSASVSQPGTDSTGAAFMSAPLNLEQTYVKFWAVRGASRSVQINYKTSHDSTSQPFLLLTTTDPRWVPDIGWLAMGDSVLIAVKVDTRQLKVSLEPTGLQFGAPATLTLWYGGADTTTDTDDLDLDLFYREDHKHSWTELGATQSLVEKSFTYNIPHFSDYAIAELNEWTVGW
jgi:hypothetical protein